MESIFECEFCKKKYKNEKMYEKHITISKCSDWYNIASHDENKTELAKNIGKKLRSFSYIRCITENSGKYECICDCCNHKFIDYTYSRMKHLHNINTKCLEYLILKELLQN